MYASGYPARTPKILERLTVGIDEGSFPAPSDPKAREAMKASLSAIINAPVFPPGDWVSQIEKELLSGQSL